MKFSTAAVFGGSALLSAATPLVKRGSLQGFDISNYQPNVDFASAYSSGARFVIIKATEGTNYIDPTFSSHYSGATQAGFVRGAYHFAQPAESSGAAQATYFFKNGGGWSSDGITLPGMLDIEYNPSGSTCYGLTQSAMVSWIQDFVDTYHGLSSRYPIIYSTNDWWSQCTGESTAFHTTCPLNVASYNSAVGTIPGGWSTYTFWQYNDDYKYGGDSDYFNGDATQLTALAKGASNSSSNVVLRQRVYNL